MQTLNITDTGTAAVNISQASISGSTFTVMGGSSYFSISVGQTKTVQIQFAPQTAGATSGTLSLMSNASNSPLTITLSGAGTQAAITMAPSSLSFGNVTVGQSSAQTAKLTNSGTADLVISAATVTGSGFGITGLSVPATITAGQSLSFNVQFAPTTAGGVNGSIAFADNAPSSPQTLTLAGTGVASSSTLTANPNSAAFGNVAVGTNSSKTITLANSGNTSVTISQASASGASFSITGLSAGQVIGAGQNATFTATFAPSSAGAVAGSISIASNATGSPLAIALSGTGLQAQIAANPSSASFGNVATGASSSQSIKLTNAGNTTLTFSQITVSGAGFSITGLTTSSTIAASGNMMFNAVFTPTSSGSVTGSIQLTTNGTPSPLTINLSGTGVAPTFLLGANPSSLSFGNVTVNTSQALATTLTNNGNSNVTISGVSVLGVGFSASGVSSGTVLTPNQTATLTVTFAPTTTGPVTGASVSVTSNATNSPATITLSGTGTPAHSATLSWTSSVTSTVVGYNVYRAASSGAYTNPVNSSPVSPTGYTDTTVQAGQTYFFVVTAVDQNGAESTNSNEVQTTVPTP